MVMNPPFRRGDAHPVFHVGEIDDPEDALERAGEILSSLNARQVQVRTCQLTVSGETVDGVEVYDPSSLVGIVVLGLIVNPDALEVEPTQWWPSEGPIGRA
jgi:hypothetical protein